MAETFCYDGPHKFDVGDYVIDMEDQALTIGRVVEILSTLPGPAYKVDFPGASFYKRKLETQLRLETDTLLIWEQIKGTYDPSALSEFQGIRSGAFCESILKADISFAAESQELLQRVAEKHFRVNGETCRKAIELYCSNDEQRILAHYRHPHSNPEEIFQFGAFLRLTRNDVGRKILQLEYESKDRVLYGKRSQINEYLSLRDALEEIEFLGAHFWYANFLHPDAYGRLPRFSYRGPEGDFVSWKERAGFSTS